MKSFDHSVKISIIVPIYGVEKYIERCARSLFEQSYQNLEYIFVNDCTKDRSMDVLDRVIQDYPNRHNQVIIINQPQNKGQAATRNMGINHASGDYIIHCDSDDWVDCSMYEKMLKVAIESEAEITICDFVKEDKENSSICHYRSDISPKQYINYISETVWWSTWNRLCLTDFIRNHNLYHKEGMNMWEDMYVEVRANYYATKIAYVNEPLYHYDITRDCSLVHKRMNNHIIQQQKECILLLEDFFKKVGFDASPFLNYRKCMIKSKYLQMSPIDYDSFQHCFPELISYPIPCSPLYKIAWNLLAKGFSVPFKILACYYKWRTSNN